jgi:hypothetical protein
LYLSKSEVKDIHVESLKYGIFEGRGLTVISANEREKS